MSCDNLYAAVYVMFTLGTYGKQMYSAGIASMFVPLSDVYFQNYAA